VFRSLLVDNAFKFLFNPLLGALGGLVGWALYEFVSGRMGALDGRWDTALYFGFLGLAVAFACNLLKPIQDGAGALRVVGGGAVSGLIAGIGGLAAAFAFTILAEKMGMQADAFLPRLLCYLFVGTIVGLTSRMTSFDKFMALAAVGGLLGGGLAVLIWAGLESSEGAASYSVLLVAMSLGFGIGVTTYSFPAFVSGGTLHVLTGQFKGQTKEIENDDITVGNNKRQLQWVLPKWEGVQDPHAKIEVKKEGKGYKHAVRNMSPKSVVVVRDGRKTSLKQKASMDLANGDVLVFATGKNFVKVRYEARTAKG
jgi:hypothetical protein